jgi:hypothetical protein
VLMPQSVTHTPHARLQFHSSEAVGDSSQPMLEQNDPDLVLMDKNEGLSAGFNPSMHGE